MGFEIRRARPDDAAGIARVWAATMPHLVRTARAVEVELTQGHSREVQVAVDGDDVVGYANIFLPPPDAEAPRVRVTIQVPPTARGRGIGTALADTVVARTTELGAGRLLTAVHDDAASTTFATRHGFTLQRHLIHSEADLTAAREPLAPPGGLRVATYDELEPQQVFDAEVRARDDDPSGLSGGPAYEEWVRVSWQNPDGRGDLSVAVLEGDRVLSFATTTADPERKLIWSNLTGTIPSARSRGLAKVAKSTALALARDAGFTVASTGNDAANAPMLAVNRWLGYRETSGAWTAERAL